MSDRIRVSINCDAQDVFDESLKPGLVKAMADVISEAINHSGSGKLTTKGRSKDGFLLTASLTELEPDDEGNPTVLEAEVRIMVVTLGTTVRAFAGSLDGTINNFDSKVPLAARKLITALLKQLMPDVIEALENFHVRI